MVLLEGKLFLCVLPEVGVGGVHSFKNVRLLLLVLGGVGVDVTLTFV